MEITGTVISARTKEPLGEAKITLSVGTTEMASLYSDGKGYFAHEEATVYIGETLTCDAEKEGFKTKTLTRTIEEQIIHLEIAMEEEAPEPIPKPNGKSILPKILIGAGIGVVVLALVLVGVFVIPKFFGNGNGEKVEILPPEIASFTAAPSTINEGGQSILTWETENAAKVIIEPLGKEFKLSGSNEVRPDKTTTYILIAMNEEGKEVEREVKVKVEILPPEIAFFKAAPSTINKGDQSILTWKTKNAVEVIIEPIGKRFKPSAKIKVRPDNTTTYTLHARNKEGKEGRREVTVKVKIKVLPHGVPGILRPVKPEVSPVVREVSPVALLPDLYISEFSLSPSTPTQGKPVKVRIGVYNRGTARAGGFTVEWWAGENFPKPAKVWQVTGSAARGGKILTYTYDGYRSWYGKLTTKAVADSKGNVKEQKEQNNVKTMEIQVRKR